MEYKIKSIDLDEALIKGDLLFLPCHVGDTVYCIIARGVMGTVFTTGSIVPRKVTKIIWDGINYEIYSERIGDGSTENDCNYYGMIGDLVFTEREQAEARLAELKKWEE